MKRPHPDTLRLYADPAYRHPDADDVRAVVVDLLDWHARRVAALVGLKDIRTVRRWIAAPTAKQTSRAAIDYAAWRLLLQAAGLVSHPRSTKGSRRKRPIIVAAASEQESALAALGYPPKE